MAVSLAVQTMDDAPANEVERLQDENRALMERLAGLEIWGLRVWTTLL